MHVQTFTKVIQSRGMMPPFHRWSLLL